MKKKTKIIIIIYKNKQAAPDVQLYVRIVYNNMAKQPSSTGVARQNDRFGCSVTYVRYDTTAFGVKIRFRRAAKSLKHERTFCVFN